MRRIALESNSEALAVSVTKAAEMVGLSRATLYPTVMAGELKSFTIGRRRLVAVSELRRWLTTTPTPKSDKKGLRATCACGVKGLASQGEGFKPKRSQKERICQTRRYGLAVRTA